MCIEIVSDWWANPYKVPGCAFVCWIIGIVFFSLFACLYEFSDNDMDATIIFAGISCVFLLICITHLVRLFMFRNTFMQAELCTQIENGNKNVSYPSDINIRPPKSPPLESVSNIPVIYVGKNTKDVYMI